MRFIDRSFQDLRPLYSGPQAECRLSKFKKVSKDRASPLLKETADSALLRNEKMRKTNVD